MVSLPSLVLATTKSLHQSHCDVICCGLCCGWLAVKWHFFTPRNLAENRLSFLKKFFIDVTVKQWHSGSNTITYIYCICQYSLIQYFAWIDLDSYTNKIKKAWEFEFAALSHECFHCFHSKQTWLQWFCMSDFVVAGTRDGSGTIRTAATSWSQRYVNYECSPRSTFETLVCSVL